MSLASVTDILKTRNLRKSSRFLFFWILASLLTIYNVDKIIIEEPIKVFNPKIIPKMLEYSKNYDLVQTNRFLDKNSMKTWPFYRRVLTSIRYIVLYFLLGIKHESSGAFRCYNFKRMNPDLIFYAKNNSYSFFYL